MRYSALLVGCAACLLISSFATLARSQPAAARSWNVEAAAAYLDRRMDLWFANGDKLRTGEGRATCVSCHTVIPYALARPALRRTMYVDRPTPQETRLIDETSKRVQTFDSQQLLYDFDEDKKGESRGTEAVLYALIIAAADYSGGRPEAPGAVGMSGISDALSRARSHLWQLQRADGSWEWLDVGLEPFESVDSTYQGAAFAAIAVGLSPALSSGTAAQSGLVKLRNYLRTHYADQNLHHRVWALLASTSMDGLLTRADRDRLVAELRQHQRTDGGWALNDLGPWRWDRTTPPFQSPGMRDPLLVSESDGYATGLIVYALKKAGLPVDHPVVERALRWLRENQRPVRVGDREWPAWRAHSLNYDREHGGTRGEPWRQLFMSDAATAFAALALLE
jgi:squalene-hopene/tetraprenyl-beta-curcumene cyclase